MIFFFFGSVFSLAWVEVWGAGGRRGDCGGGPDGVLLWGLGCCLSCVGGVEET